MQGFSSRCAVIGALVLGACGSPAELDEDAFPTLDKTGYGVTGAGAGSGTTDVTGGGNVAGSSSTPATGGSSGMATGGSQGQAMGNTGGMGTTGGSIGGSCPSDITVLFARPIAQGGCTSGGGCHEAGGPVKPDLVSPNVAQRLLNMPSSCTKTSSGMTVAPRPYIGQDDSFLEEKIAGSPQCGLSMPFFMPDALSAADEQCIIDWIDEIAGG